MGEAHWPTLEIRHGRERWAEVILVTLGQKYVKAILRFSKFSSLCWESGESPNGSTSVSPGPGLGGCHRARPLSIPAGHVASARNKPLLFKALRLGFFFFCYSNKAKPILSDKTGTGDLEYYSRNSLCWRLESKSSILEEFRSSETD